MQYESLIEGINSGIMYKGKRVKEKVNLCVDSMHSQVVVLAKENSCALCAFICTKDLVIISVCVSFRPRDGAERNTDLGGSSFRSRDTSCSSEVSG